VEAGPLSLTDRSAQLQIVTSSHGRAQKIGFDWQQLGQAWAW
jgi:hypothetical protein